MIANQVLIWALMQLTVVLAGALVVAWVFHRSASRAHAILVSALFSVLFLPAATLIVASNNWGCWFAPMPQTAEDFTPGDHHEAWFAPWKNPAAGGGETSQPSEASVLAGAPSSENGGVRQPGPEEAQWPTVAGSTGWIGLLLVAWLIMSLLMGCQVIRRIAASMRILRAARVMKRSDLVHQLDRAKRSMGVDQEVDLLSSSAIGCPMICCWGRVQLLIPNSCLELDSVDWHGVFCHELAHYKRRDHIWQMLAEILRCALPWHPLILYYRRWITRYSERACDQWAVKAGAAPERYAETILSFLEAKPLALFSPMASRGVFVINRIERLLKGSEMDSTAGNRWTMSVAIIMTMAVVMASLAQPHRNRATSTTTVQEQQEVDRERWAKALTSAPENSRWFVGANFGRELSALPGDQAYDILKSCWSEIADSVRPQILKGFCPGFKKTEGVNPRLFDILDMAYSDPDDRVRSFARTYVNDMTFSLDADDEEAYKKWRATIEGKDAADIIIDEVRQFAKGLDDLNESQIPAAIEQIEEARTDFREFTAMRNAAIEAGMIDKLNQWIDEGKLEKEARIESIISTITKSTDKPTAKMPKSALKKASGASQEEFKGYPVEDLIVGDNKKQRYFLCGPASDQTAPSDGWKLLLILPGGDGSANFNPFCRRIHKNAIPPGYIAAQLVAPVWSDDENRIVWPTKKVNPDRAKFSTEQFIKAVIEDVSARHKIDKRYVFTLGWSSGGPPIYAAALTKNSPVTGTFVAMSVFKPRSLPPLSAAKNRAFYLLHSPQDFINIDQHARFAETELGEKGAKVKLQTYSGGHGWRQDPFGHIRRGVTWLEKQVQK